MESICFDAETTGLVPKGSDSDEILTLSIIRRDGTVLFDEGFRPSRKTEWPHASRVNGIYPEDVRGLPAIESVVPELQRIFTEADEIIGYNVAFDLGFLAAIGVKPRLDARIVDAMRSFAKEYARLHGIHGSKDARWLKLTDAAAFVGHKWHARAHTSLADAYAALAVQKWAEERERGGRK